MTTPFNASTRVFDAWAMEQLLRSQPATALRVLAEQIETGECSAKLRNIMAIGGAEKEAQDTSRVTIDLGVQLVKVGAEGR